MTPLSETLADVTARIGRYRGSRAINEQNTKATLIEPVLRSLGWNVEDLEEVQREYKRKAADRPVDYALFILREPRLFVEAKALGQDLDDRKWANQIMGYASVAGVKWVVLTNGDDYRVYNSHAAVPVEDKLFRKFLISESDSIAEDTLALLSKDRMRENEIDLLWKAFFVDRQIGCALEELVSGEPDSGLVSILRKRTNLTRNEVKASLSRARVKISFPQPVVPLPAPPDWDSMTPGEKAAWTRRQRRGQPPNAPKRGRPEGAPPNWDEMTAGQKAAWTRKQRQLKGAKPPSPTGARISRAEVHDPEPPKRKRVASTVSLQDIIAAGLLKPPVEIEKTYKGQRLTARLEPDGRIRFQGKVFTSLSAAGAEARRSVVGRRMETDGWIFWRFRDKDGNLKQMDVLRQQLK